MNTRRPGMTAAFMAGGLLLTGCATSAAEAKAVDGELPRFSSIEEAWAAVDEVLGCEDNLTAEPTENKIVNSTVEYAMCTKNVQIELYANEEDRKATGEAFSNASSEGFDRMPIVIVEGANWAAFDFSEARGLPSRLEDMQKLAKELNTNVTWIEGVGSE